MTSHHVPAGPPWWLPLVFAAGMSLLGTVYVDYMHNDKVIASDVAVLKSQRETDKEQLNRIEDTLEKLRGQITWALGKPKGQ